MLKPISSIFRRDRATSKSLFLADQRTELTVKGCQPKIPMSSYFSRAKALEIMTFSGVIFWPMKHDCYAGLKSHMVNLRICTVKNNYSL